MKKKITALVTILLILSFLPTISKAQTLSEKEVLDNLCKKWIVDSIEINDINKKFPAPDNIKNNYTDFNKNGTFRGQDSDVILTGKWKLDYKKMQIINFNIDNPLIKGDIVFNIITISDRHLAITSKPMSGNHVTMHYKPGLE